MVPRTRILDRNEQIAGRFDLRSYPQHPRLAHDRAHRLDAIQDQIEDDLLQLNPVALGQLDCSFDRPRP